MLNGLLHFVNVLNGRCGVEVPAERADYNQSIFCLWSPPIELMDSRQSSVSFDWGDFGGSAFSNHSALQEGIQSLLKRKDMAEAEMALYYLREDNPVSFGKTERAELLRNAVQ